LQLAIGCNGKNNQSGCKAIVMIENFKPKNLGGTTFGYLKLNVD
jgi:hypothetical protein